MKEKIFTALKTAILIGGKTSVSDATINLFASMIDGEKITEDQISEAVKPYIPLLQATQANINSVAASSVQAKESELNKTIEDLKKSNLTPPKQEENEVSDLRESIQSLTQTVQTLSTAFGAQQTERAHEAFSQKLSSILAEKKVPEWYSSDVLDGRTFKDEGEVNVWAEKISSKWVERNQSLANDGFKGTVPPSSGNSNISDGEAVAAMIKEGTQKIVEQKQN